MGLVTHCAEYVALATAVFGLATATLVRVVPAVTAVMQAPILIGMVLTFVLIFLVAIQTTHFARALRSQRPERDDKEGLSLQELQRLLRCAPPAYRAIGAAGLALLVLALLVAGPVSWSSSEPFTPAHAFGMSACLAALSGMMVPLLGGFARLPESRLEPAAPLREDV